jgi:hypothetical protein
MKRKIKIFTIGCYAAGFILFHIYVYGIFMDYEYPYWLTIYRASHAPFRNGDSAQVIAEKLFPNQKLHWHTCNYCVRYAPEGCSHVDLQVVASDNSVTSYPFIFNHKTGELRTHPDGLFLKKFL